MSENQKEFMTPMETLTTDLTDSKEVAAFLTAIQHAAEANYKESNGELVPVCVFLKGGKMGVVDLRQGMQNSDTKDGVAEMLKELRQDCTAVTFISEVWISTDKKKPEGMSEEAFMESVTPPSQDPERKEGLMLNLYVGKHSHSFLNMISREGGPHLEGWKATPSTKHHSPEGYQQKGRFV